MDKNKLKILIKVLLIIAAVAATLFLSVSKQSHAIVRYGADTLLGSQSVFSKHIKDATILDVDIATSTQISYEKIGQGFANEILFFGAGLNIATSSTFTYSTSTQRMGIGTTTPGATLGVSGSILVEDSITTGKLIATSTLRLRGVEYTMPSADGGASTALTTNGAGTLSWASASASKFTVSLTASTSITAGNVVSIFPQILVDSETGTTDCNNGFGRASATTQYKTAINFIKTAAIQNTNSIKVILSKTGSPADSASFSIQADSAGNPSGTALSSGTIAAGSIVSGVWNTITMSPSYTLSANTAYWLVASRSGAGDDSNYYQWTGTTAETFADGDTKYNNAGSWVDSTDCEDQWFTIENTLDAGKIVKAVADNEWFETGTIGIAENNISAGAVGDITITGITGNVFTGLAPGQKYYLSATAGLMSTSTPATPTLVGIAASSTAILITVR